MDADPLTGTNRLLIGDRQGKNNPGFVDLALISWPVLPAGGVLQQKTTLGATNWTGVTNAISVVGGQNQVIISLSSSNQYFRLSYP